MAKTLQLRRGTTAEITANTPASGELFVDTDKKTVTVGDGTTAGGIILARNDRVSDVSNTANGANGLAAGAFNKANSSVSFQTIYVAGQPNVIANTANAGLTFVAGSGIAITTVGTSNTVTIAASGGGASFPTVSSVKLALAETTLSHSGDPTTIATITVTPSSASAPVHVTFNFGVIATDTESDAGIEMKLYINGSEVSNSSYSVFLSDNGAATYAQIPISYTHAFVTASSSPSTLTLRAWNTGGNTVKVGSGLISFPMKATSIVW